MVNVDVGYLTILLSLVLPALTGVITKRMASSGVKSLTLLLLSIIAGVVQQLIYAGGSFDLREALGQVLLQFVFAVGVHYGLLKPASITGTNGVLQTSTASFGVGSAVSTAGNEERPLGH